MGIEDVIGDFADDDVDEGEFVLTRSTTVGNGYDMNGRAVADVTATLKIYAFIAPVQPRDLRLFPEGQRSEDTRTVYTETPIKGRDGKSAPDVIAIPTARSEAGEPFEVYSVRDWRDSDGRFFEALVARKPTGGGP